MEIKVFNKKLIRFCLLGLIGVSSFAIKKGDKVISGFDNAKGYLDYALWAMAALGAISVGFMLFNTPNDPILKHLARWTALAGVLSLAYQVPGWFGLNIII